MCNGHKGQSSHTEAHAASFSPKTFFSGATVNPGDFVFFYHSTNPAGCSDATEDAVARKNAIVGCSTAEFSIYHVAMMVSPTEIVHATKIKGVIRESLAAAVKREKPDKIELTLVGLDTKWKNKAVEWAGKKIGAGYNPLFLPHCENAEGRCYYCSEFVQEAYIETKEKNEADPFPNTT
uniref:Uncharacterized protein n=1 Tax=Ditylenchus dipsaci TaxID=166011 RepID=A0A915DQ49_9BILA